MPNQEGGCKGCLISKGKYKPVGGVIHLNGNWVLNHYAGNEGYLGWLALSPYKHRMSFVELDDEELKALGPNVKSIQKHLDAYWKEMFPSDKIVRLYIAYFFESVFNMPKSDNFHLHIHLIPRFQSLDPALREYSDGTGNNQKSSIDAWKTPCYSKHNAFPSEYQKNDDSYKKLMKWMRNCIIKDNLPIDKE